MSERARAIRILKRTREILAERLTERVLEAEEEILAEAEGESFFSEIETIYEQLGIRLAHVNQMLAHLPADEPTQEAGRPSDSPWSAGAASSRREELSEGAADEAPDASPAPPVLALPAPGAAPTNVAALGASTLLMFAAQTRRGDVFAAAASLEASFGLGPRRAQECARLFAARCQHDPSYFEHAARLHNYLQADALSRAFGLMCDHLGLSGGEALSALMWWRTRAARR